MAGEVGPPTPDGFDGVLVKPFDSPSLARALTEAVERRRVLAALSAR